MLVQSGLEVRLLLGKSLQNRCGMIDRPQFRQELAVEDHAPIVARQLQVPGSQTRGLGDRFCKGSGQRGSARLWVARVERPLAADQITSSRIGSLVISWRQAMRFGPGPLLWE